MVHIGLVGFGRTGRIVAKEILQHDKTKLSCVFKKTMDETIGQDVGKLLGVPGCIGNRYIYHTSELESVVSRLNIDAIVDFSTPDAVMEYVPILAKKRINLVICSTNYTEEQVNNINKFSDRIGIVWAPNVTEGINILIAIGKVIKEIWQDSDIEIIETHFAEKKDTSGTALMIAEALKESEQVKFGRKRNESRKHKEVVIHSIRAGGIIGKHTIIFGQPHQTITITHESTDRQAFGRGAIRAAEWVKGKKGIFTMEDVLNLNVKIKN
jgi:4-hydroxy-tetrahydrodipicolinate reductase